MKTLDEIKGEMLLTDKEIKVREDEYWELYRDLWNAYEIDEADYESGFDYWRLEAQIDKVLSIPISKGGVCPACNGEKYITLRGIIGDVDMAPAQ